MTDINKLLAAREITHGDFSRVSKTYYKLTMTTSEYTVDFDNTLDLGLDMIMLKILRFIHGDKNHLYHLDDIIGYVTLMKKYIASKETP